MVPSLVTVGLFVKETIKYASGEISKPVLGGCSIYSSIVSRKIGMDTGVVTIKGNDISEAFLQPIYQAKVDTRGLKTKGPHTTTIQLVYDKSGDKELVYLKKAPKILFEDIPPEYHGASMFYLCPINYDVPIETVRGIYKKGIGIAVDLGGYGGVHCEKSFNMDINILKEIISCSHIVKASEEDCRRLFGNKNKEDEEEQAKLLLEWGADISIITCGERGAVVADKKDIFKVPAFPGEVVDTTGGGDSFVAGFLVEYLKSKNIEKSIIFASATAILVIGKTGGVTISRMPTLKEVNDKISEYKKTIKSKNI
jgi:sugar/nucleoside kinase (ribokinase family)